MENPSFISFVLSIPMEAWHEGYRFVAILFGLLLLMGALMLAIFAGLLCVGILHALDYWFVESEFAKGRITARQFTPAHRETTLAYNVVLKMAMPITQYVPDNYDLRISIGDKSARISIDGNDHARFRPGQSVRARYRVGRLTGRLYIESIR